MALDSSGLSGRTRAALLDANLRHLTPNPLHTPNMPHTQIVNRNTNLLMDRLSNTYITPGSNPVNALSFQSSLLDLFRLNCILEEQLLASGNTAYLQAQLVERQRHKIGEMENQIRSLELDIVMWKARFTDTQEVFEKLIQTRNASSTGIASTMLSTRKGLPPPLDRNDYRQVRFWTVKSFEEYCNNLAGKTDALATQPKRRGRRPKSESDDDRHPYLENADGSTVPREILVKVGQRARRLWQAMNAAGQAPASWGKASEDAHIYFNSEMLNDPEFIFFRYCEGNWKIMRWATKSYASWAHNHIKSSGAGHSKTPRANKRKRDDPSLLQIDEDRKENVAITIPLDSSRIGSNSDALALPAPSASALAPIQQPATTLADPLDKLYDEVDKNTSCGAAIPPAMPSGKLTALSHTTATTSSSALGTIGASSSVPMKKENHGTQDIELGSAKDNTTGTTGMTQSLTSALSGLAPPLAGIKNNECVGQRQSSAKRVKRLAVVGTGLTDKNFCMKDWLEENPDGLKDAFEKYFKALPVDVRKTYKDRATAAQKAARAAKKKGST